MAIELYEGKLNIYWKGADFRNMVYCQISDINISTTKRNVFRQCIYYVTCESKLCEHKLNQTECPMVTSKDRCLCPNGKINMIHEPRKDTKMYKDFLELVQQIPCLLFWKQYSEFVWQNREHKCDQDDYEMFKRIPMFSMKAISDAKHELPEALAVIEETREYYTRDLNYSTGPNLEIIASLRMKYKDELDAYLKMINMEIFLDANAIELQKFRKHKKQLFHLCGEYVVIKIPHLTSFEQHGMQDIFIYPDIKSHYCNSESNAVKLEDFVYIYKFLLNLQPTTYGAKEYYSCYIPTIKEQFPEFCKKYNLKFLEGVV